MRRDKDNLKSKPIRSKTEALIIAQEITLCKFLPDFNDFKLPLPSLQLQR